MCSVLLEGPQKLSTLWKATEVMQLQGMLLKLSVLFHGLGAHCVNTPDWLKTGRLKPEEKVSMAIDMTDACVGICAEGIKAQRPKIAHEELLEKLRERIEYAKGRQRHGGAV